MGGVVAGGLEQLLGNQGLNRQFFGFAFEAGSGIHRVADDCAWRVVGGADFAHHQSAKVQPHADGDGRGFFGFECLIEGGERGADAARLVRGVVPVEPVQAVLGVPPPRLGAVAPRRDTPSAARGRSQRRQRPRPVVVVARRSPRRCGRPPRRPTARRARCGRARGPPRSA